LTDRDRLRTLAARARVGQRILGRLLGISPSWLFEVTAGRQKISADLDGLLKRFERLDDATLQTRANKLRKPLGRGKQRPLPT